MLKKNNLPFLALFCTFLALSIHIVALKYSLYFLFEPLDIVVHGFMMLGVSIILVLYTPRLIAITGVVLIPIAWEIFQHIFLSQKGFSYDTIFDIVLGVGVGLIAIYFISRKN